MEITSNNRHTNNYLQKNILLLCTSKTIVDMQITGLLNPQFKISKKMLDRRFVRRFTEFFNHLFSHHCKHKMGEWNYSPDSIFEF